MKQFHSSMAIVVGIGLLLFGSGCGGSPQKNPEEEANKALEAIKRLADALAKDANGPDAHAALKDFQATEFDPQVQPTEGQEIRKIYRERIQGKYKGEVAQQIQGLIAGLERRMPPDS